MQFFRSGAHFVHRYLNVKITIIDLMIYILMLLTYDVIMTVPAAYRLWSEELHYKSVATSKLSTTHSVSQSG